MPRRQGYHSTELLSPLDATYGPRSPFGLLPGTEDLAPEDPGAAYRYLEGLATGLNRGGVDLYNTANAMQSAGRGSEPPPLLDPNRSLASLQPQQVTDPRGAAGRVGAAMGEPAPMLSMMAPFGLAAGPAALPVEGGLAMLGAAAGQGARELGGGEGMALTADVMAQMFGPAAVVKAVASKAVIPAFVGGRVKWQLNPSLKRLTTNMDLIGTGEGTKIRGKGNYSAQAKPVADSYAKGLERGAGAEFMRYGEVPEGTMIGGKPSEPGKKMWIVDTPLREPKYFSIKYEAADWADANSGYTYGVLHDTNPEDLIDLDLTIGEQPWLVEGSADEIIARVESDGRKPTMKEVITTNARRDPEGYGGKPAEHIYDGLVTKHQQLGAPDAEDAALFELSEAGLPGSQFFDQNSRAKYIKSGKTSDDLTRNYVMFQDQFTYVDPKRTDPRLIGDMTVERPFLTVDKHAGMVRSKPKTDEELWENIAAKAKVEQAAKAEKERTQFIAGYDARVEDNPMAAIHDLDADAVLHADELGGIPAPSVAVVNPLDQGFSDQSFGNVTLVGDRKLVDPDLGTSTYPSDAYSVRYPKQDVFTSYTDKQRETISELETSVGKYMPPNKGSLSALHSGFTVSFNPDGGLRLNPAAKMLYLKEHKLAAPAHVKGESQKHFGERLDQAMRKHLDRFEEWRETFQKEHGLVKKPRLFADERKWGLGVKDESEPLTLDNLVKRMHRSPVDIPGSEVTSGLASEYGMGGLRAHVNDEFATFDQMDLARGTLEKNPVDFQKEVKGRFQDLRMQDTFVEMSEADLIESIIHYHRTGSLMDLDGGMVAAHVEDEVDDFIGFMQDGPSPYFEAKPMRGVKLEEFSKAIVPRDVDPKVIKALKKRGLDVEKYTDPNNRKGILARQKELFFQYLLGLTGGGAAAGAANEVIKGEPSPDGSLLRPY